LAPSPLQLLFGDAEGDAGKRGQAGPGDRVSALPLFGGSAGSICRNHPPQLAQERFDTDAADALVDLRVVDRVVVLVPDVWVEAFDAGLTARRPQQECSWLAAGREGAGGFLPGVQSSGSISVNPARGSRFLDPRGRFVT